MLRLLLTLHFAAISLAGPCLCCCTVTGVLAGFAADEQPEIAAKSPCKCQAGSDNRERSDDRKPCEETPCSARLFRAQPIQQAFAVAVPALQEMTGFVGVGGDPATFVSLKVDLVQSALRECALANPRESSRAILRALSVLRC